MTILGIESSCDETSASVIRATDKNKKVELLSNVVASSLSLHAKTGGIIPEVAAREQVIFMIPVIEKALEVLKNPKEEIDAIAVTVGPGLIGSLLVGVETAKTFAYVWNKPLIPVNHLFGHLYANWIDQEDKREIEFPAIGLIVSGGHTDLVLIKKHQDLTWLGGTRDDAAGEAFDKTARLLNLPYPGGPFIEKMAEGVDEDIFHFPRPLVGSPDLDFSFSGLKAAVLREINKIGKDNLTEENVKNISYSLQEAVFDILIKKTTKAIIKYSAKSLILGGGVCANQTLNEYFKKNIEEKLNINIFIPRKDLCTDNGAMIATAGFFNNQKVDWREIIANPELYFD